jgi:hypothetical protein
MCMRTWNRLSWTPTVDNTKPLTEKDDWRRLWTVPEEELPPCITTKRKPGEPRWFRSPNVMCIEQYRRRKAGTPGFLA